jgi:N-acetylmuramoyl-L-alanine amidase
MGCRDEEPLGPIERVHSAEQELRALAHSQSEDASVLPRANSAAPTAPQLEHLRVYRGDGLSETRVRIVAELTGSVPIRRRERREHETRLLVDFEGASRHPGVQPLSEVRSGGVERVWLKDTEQGVRLELVLARGAQYRMFVLGEPQRVVFDVELPHPEIARGAQLVLIDPGHGGEDRGSPGLFGLWEGEVALDISRRLQRALATLAPGVRTRLTRDSDVYITLEERAAMANALGADLFVSVHLNAANATIERGGVATFVLDTNNERNVLRLAARENGTRTSQVSPLQFLVGTLVRSEQREQSERLARLIQRDTLGLARRFLPDLTDRGVKSAMFYVLVGAQMPAVLVEASFITQPEEAQALAMPRYREALAQGIAQGIAEYLGQN